MRITSIELRNFRRFDYVKYEIDKNIVLITGNNALGKTSILESIYVCSLSKSPRTNNDTEMIKFDELFARVRVTAERNYDVIISHQGKRLTINNLEKNKASSFIGDFKVVLFTPDDLKLIKGSPVDARRFMDVEIGKVSKEYLDLLKRHRLILKQRNEILKKMNGDFSILDIITEQLIMVHLKIMNFRLHFIKQICQLANEYYFFLAKGNLRIKYIETVNQENPLSDYKAKYQSDLLSKTTSIGIHRDQLEFYINDINGKNYASQGEIRTAVLCIKLALMDFIYEKTKEKPVVLLDDCLSELDVNRQQALIKLIKNNHQTFITSTDYHALVDVVDDEFMNIIME